MEGTKPAQASATWTTSQCPFAIEYTPQVLEAIRMEVVAAFQGPPHGGLEIGGILLGMCSADQVTITGFLPVQCEHAFGPSFELSANDHGRLSDVIAGLQAAGQTIVGWFHSHTRTGIFLSKADLEIHNHHFKDPRQVALVLKPVALKPTLCGFFFREADGSIHGNESYREFELAYLTANDGQARVGGPERDGPFATVPDAPQSPRRPREETELPATAQEFAPALPRQALSPIEEHSNREGAFILPDTDVSQPWESPLDPLGMLDETPQRRPGGWRHRWAWAVAGLVIVLALAAAYAVLNRSNREAPATEQQPATYPALGLKIQRQGADLVLTWDRNASDLLGATAGLLSIKDGQTQKEMGLTDEQLHSASIVISPESDRVEIQLTILLPNQRTASESGIVVLPARRSTAPVEIKTTVPARIYTQTEIRSQSPQVEVSKLFVAPPARNQAPEPQLTDELPALKGTGPAERTQPLPLASLRTFTVIPPPPSAIPAGRMSPGSTSPSGPSRSEQVGGNAQPAELISRRDPIYPYDARMRHLKGVVVLEGKVGMDGRVKELMVVSGLQPLRQAALNAVRQWVYRPAHLNGKTIEAPLRVEVQFRDGM